MNSIQDGEASSVADRSHEHVEPVLPVSIITFWIESTLVRGRRKSSQKLAKRRTCVWGGGGLDHFRKASFKKKKKNQLHVNYVRSAPLGPAANRLELF